MVVFGGSSRDQPSLLVEAQRDAEAFAAVYDAYHARVLRFFAGRRLDADLARDLTAETFAVALQRRMQFRGHSAEEEQGWLFAIARSQLAAYWRSGRVEQDALSRAPAAPTPGTDEELERVEERVGAEAVIAQLGTALAHLPGDQRQAVELRVLEDRTYEEIAVAAGVSQDVARARVSRGLRALAERLDAANR